MTSQYSGASQKIELDTSSANTQSGQATKFMSAPDSKAQPMRLIAGPCLLESREHGLMMAQELALITQRLGIFKNFIFKASLRKANRTRYSSVREGMDWREGADTLRLISEIHEMDVLTDVHCDGEAECMVGWGIIPQIPALLMRQTDVIEAAAHCRAIHIKKGQFAAPEDMQWVVEKVRQVNPDCHVMISERGHSFGYYNLVVDMRGFGIMKNTSGAHEVLFDVTHSVQLPSSEASGVSGGLREFIDPLARAAISAGADGLFCEVHDDPENALSDGPCQIPLKHFESFLKRVLELRVWSTNNPLTDLSP